MVDTEKETITFNVNPEISLAFRKKCLDNNQRYSEAVEELMTEYIKRKI